MKKIMILFGLLWLCSLRAADSLSEVSKSTKKGIARLRSAELKKEQSEISKISIVCARLEKIFNDPTKPLPDRKDAKIQQLAICLHEIFCGKINFDLVSLCNHCYNLINECIRNKFPKIYFSESWKDRFLDILDLVISKELPMVLKNLEDAGCLLYVDDAFLQLAMPKAGLGLPNDLFTLIFSQNGSKYCVESKKFIDVYTEAIRLKLQTPEYNHILRYGQLSVCNPQHDDSGAKVFHSVIKMLVAIEQANPTMRPYTPEDVHTLYQKIIELKTRFSDVYEQQISLLIKTYGVAEGFSAQYPTSIVVGPCPSEFDPQKQPVSLITVDMIGQSIEKMFEDAWSVVQVVHVRKELPDLCCAMVTLCSDTAVVISNLNTEYEKRREQIEKETQCGWKNIVRSGRHSFETVLQAIVASRDFDLERKNFTLNYQVDRLRILREQVQEQQNLITKLTEDLQNHTVEQKTAQKTAQTQESVIASLRAQIVELNLQKLPTSMACPTLSEARSGMNDVGVGTHPVKVSSQTQTEPSITKFCFRRGDLYVAPVACQAGDDRAKFVPTVLTSWIEIDESE